MRALYRFVAQDIVECVMCEREIFCSEIPSHDTKWHQKNERLS